MSSPFIILLDKARFFFYNLINMKKNKDKISHVKKIVVDEKTNDPIIIEVPESEYLSEPIPEKDFVEMKSHKSIGKQMTMERILGIKKSDEAVGKRQKIFKSLMTLIFIIFMVGVLAYTAYQDFSGASNKQFPSKAQLKAILGTGWQFFLLSIFALLLGFFFRGLKSAIMCKALTKKAHFGTCLETAIIGIYYNNVTPLAVGGQPFEIYHLSKHGVHGGVASSIPIASFFLNQLAFVLLAIASLVLFKVNIFGAPKALTSAFPDTFFVLAIIGCFCCLFMPSLVVIFCMLPKFGAKLVYFVVKLGTKLKIVKHPNDTLQKTIKTVVHNSHCLKKIASNPLVFFVEFVLSFLENICNGSIAFFVLKGFGLNLGIGFVSEWIVICMICFILYASITFIPTPGNSGAADLSFFLLFESVLLAGLVFPAMIVWRLASFYSTLLLGFAFATWKKRMDKKAKNEPIELFDTSAEIEQIALPENLVIPIIEENDDLSVGAALDEKIDNQ